MPIQVLGLKHWRERKLRVSLVGEGPHERILRHMTGKLKLTNVDFAGQQSLKKFGDAIRYLRKPNGGQASAFNFGEVVALLDADDV